MAIGDLTAEQQVRVALETAREVLQQPYANRIDRVCALNEIREALKRMDEAGAA